jgi:hypothetical protein
MVAVLANLPQELVNIKVGSYFRVTRQVLK